MRDELKLLRDADRLAHAYTASTEARRVFPSASDKSALDALAVDLPDQAGDPADTLALLQRYAEPATVTSNGPNYFGFVIGAVLPAAAAADRLVSAWDQCASAHLNSPAVAAIEHIAAGWLLEVLDLPRQSSVGFGTSATACGLACLATARQTLLARRGWDVAQRGLTGAPRIRVVVSATAHVTIHKILRVLGFGGDDIHVVDVDAHGCIDVSRIPVVDDTTILCLQAGEVNTGEFDAFASIIPHARASGAWVHVDGAFGLWARASAQYRHLTHGVEDADSWTTDGHKWLNTPYDCAMAIYRDGALASQTLNAGAAYAQSEDSAQKNLTLEFSRRARGVAVWAALHSLGKQGVAELVNQCCRHATALADGCRELGIPVLNRVVLNQVLCGFDDERDTQGLVDAIQEDGRVWFGGTRWHNRAAFRLSVSSWRTEQRHIERCLAIIREHLPAATRR
ncbi:MAG: aminotransferase class V-fold PLP-dependent enzyme [Pseudomonadota bacterium]